MAGHLLGVLEPSVVLQVNRDTGCPPGVTSDRGEKTRCLSPLPNRSPGVVAIWRPSRHRRSERINALEQGLPALKAGGDGAHGVAGVLPFPLTDPAKLGLDPTVPCDDVHGSPIGDSNAMAHS